MAQALMITSGIATIAMAASAAFALRGVYTLISGRCSLRGTRLRGKRARLAGLFLVGQFLVAGVIDAPLFDAYHWGYPSVSATGRVASSIVGAAIFVSMGVVGYLLALKYAKAEQTESGSQPDAFA